MNAQILYALAGTIRELGEIPAGPAYAALMGHCSHGEFEASVDALVRAGYVARRPGHVLAWTGPAPDPVANAVSGEEVPA